MDRLMSFWQSISSFVNEYVIAPIQQMQVIDVIDVLLLATVLYALYCFLRTRRAGRVLLGLFAVIAVSIFVTLLQMPALSYVVRLFAASVFFCVVVIFQPEFREALERLGNSSLLNPGKNHVRHKKFEMAREIVDETVNAVERMSDTKTGALIVFEGLTKLGEYIETGKVIDARITSHMLRNIFFDKAPLHDGALIIRDMRIYAASCVLPSAQGKMDFSNVGTRHRAAVGLTEVSDALVVVISEETGVVSVAQDGKLLRDVDSKTLYDILMTYITGNTYLRFKRANLRSDYLAVLEIAEKKAIKTAKKNRRQRAETERDPLAAFDNAPPEKPEESERFSSRKAGADSRNSVGLTSDSTSDTDDLSQNL